MAKILIVDDDPQPRFSFERLLQSEGHELFTAPSAEKGIEIVRQEQPDLVIQDLRLPGMGGLEAFSRMREIDPKLSVIIMTAFGTTETAIEATKMGAFDYVLKPFDIPDILEVIEKAIEAGRFMRKKVKVDTAGNDEPQTDLLLGRSSQMHELYKAIGRVAPTDATVLIMGESGTGKELVARAIYQHSLRAAAPFLVINCVAIPETLLESELFGYEKGAFTGASTRRVGKIEQANKGSVFLDEIGDMPLGIQAKILRLLQERHIERLGGRGTIPVDVRIIAATNRDLAKAVEEGRFREDLYYRLNVVTLELPPLRERKGDIPLLAEYFLRRYAREAKQDAPGLTEAALHVLEAHNWPGNVRELSNTMHKALIFNRGAPLEPEDMSRAMGIAESGPTAPCQSRMEDMLRQWLHDELAAGSRKRPLDELCGYFEQMVISEALVLTGGNRTRAAKLLGLSRPTLLARIEKYGLKVETNISS